MLKWLNLKLEGRLFTEGLVQHTPMVTGWLTCILEGFVPAFSLLLCDSEYARKPQDVLSLGRYAA